MGEYGGCGGEEGEGMEFCGDEVERALLKVGFWLAVVCFFIKPLF